MLNIGLVSNETNVSMYVEEFIRRATSYGLTLLHKVEVQLNSENTLANLYTIASPKDREIVDLHLFLD